jgi:DNA-binding transcriptional ArsR family regulator
MTEVKDLPSAERYLIFQALSHPARTKILTLLGNEELTFASLKRELGVQSSGQLQHHLQKLSGLISNTDGAYRLTSTGRRALEILRASEKSGKSLDILCCLPSPSELARNRMISGKGVFLRVSVGTILTTLTVGIVANYFFPNQAYLSRFDVFGGASVGSWIDAVIFAFFGISFLISSATGYPGCEITAIPNLFTKKKRYCSCLIVPFNIPNGRLLRNNGKDS